MKELSKEDLMEAVSIGVKEAIHEMCETGDGYSGLIRSEQFFEAIKSGVSQSMWEMITNATDMPCSDFFNMIKEGTKEAHLHLGK